MLSPNSPSPFDEQGRVKPAKQFAREWRDSILADGGSVQIVGDRLVIRSRSGEMSLSADSVPGQAENVSELIKLVREESPEPK